MRLRRTVPQTPKSTTLLLLHTHRIRPARRLYFKPWDSILQGQKPPEQEKVRTCLKGFNKLNLDHRFLNEPEPIRIQERVPI